MVLVVRDGRLEPNARGALPEGKDVTESPSPGGKPGDPSGGTGKAPSYLGMFAKYWLPGQVKTRLGKAVGMAAAAELHRHFVLQLAADLATSAATRSVVVAPPEQQPAFADALPAGWRLIAQGDGDLGDRIERFFAEALQEAWRVVLIGSDCPLLTAERIETAIEALETHDAVLGPAADGGYYLIGLRGPWRPSMRRLFTDVPWGGPEVARVTRQRLREADASWQELPRAEDIDTLDCLQRLATQLRETATTHPLRRPVEGVLAAAGQGPVAAARNPAQNLAQNPAQNPDQGLSEQAGLPEKANRKPSC
jgi:rSAM/selenodomain-associated transferase 1